MIKLTFEDGSTITMTDGNYALLKDQAAFEAVTVKNLIESEAKKRLVETAKMAKK